MKTKTRGINYSNKSWISFVLQKSAVSRGERGASFFVAPSRA
jgi:hypothetical protein